MAAKLGGKEEGGEEKEGRKIKFMWFLVAERYSLEKKKCARRRKKREGRGVHSGWLLEGGGGGKRKKREKMGTPGAPKNRCRHSREK